MEIKSTQVPRKHIAGVNVVNTHNDNIKAVLLFVVKGKSFSIICLSFEFWLFLLFHFGKLLDPACLRFFIIKWDDSIYVLLFLGLNGYMQVRCLE